MAKKLLRIGCFTILGLLIVAILTLSFIALRNRSLPIHSQANNTLSDLDKARIAEALHLRATLGDDVWPGWSQLDTPLIVYNEGYAFLVGYPDPPAGWLKMPQRTPQGSAWEAVPGDLFEGEVYYRQPLPDPDTTPQNFTVLVGDRWVATMQTLESMESTFYREYRSALPPFLRAVYPYRLFWRLVMPNTEIYIGALLHESFHALQGTLVPEHLASAEYANADASRYPYDDDGLADAWQHEMDVLVAAVRAGNDAQALELAREFLATRDARRVDAGLDESLIDYERQRDWLEGLAKYSELTLVQLAGKTSGYTPVSSLEADPHFKRYETFERFYMQQLGQASYSAKQTGESRHYYGGMAQAVLLDRLAPDWKEQAFNGGIALEDLLRDAVNP